MAEQFSALFGSIADVGRTGSGGYRRFAWTGEDRLLREWFTGEAVARGAEVVPDRAGNLWAWWGDPDTEPGVVLGSHLDSVPDGGAYDGPLGIVSSLLAVEAAGPLARPVAVACFADEEGARFGTACAGSRLLTGALDPSQALALKDADGITMAEARSDRPDKDPEALARIGCFVELHVEQGRALEVPVGLATEIWPHGRWRFDLEGQANHAGTTRLVDRDDPVLAFASMVLAARRHAEQLGLLATFGRLQVSPNAVNAVPGLVRAWLDARAPTEDLLLQLLERLGGDPTQESWTSAVRFDLELADRLSDCLSAVPRLPTGAGHDAGVLQEHGIPTAMLFVRNPTGISHAPEEHADLDDCLAGVAALTTVVQELAG
ncbi:MAG: allantoate amidohydrolase [Frankiales bacterium]|nr:allantoate amidohydrolase [Frankiales bacterium]